MLWYPKVVLVGMAGTFCAGVSPGEPSFGGARVPPGEPSFGDAGQKLFRLWSVACDELITPPEPQNLGGALRALEAATRATEEFCGTCYSRYEGRVFDVPVKRWHSEYQWFVRATEPAPASEIDLEPVAGRGQLHDGLDVELWRARGDFGTGVDFPPKHLSLQALTADILRQFIFANAAAHQAQALFQAITENHSAFLELSSPASETAAVSKECFQAGSQLSRELSLLRSYSKFLGLAIQSPQLESHMETLIEEAKSLMESLPQRVLTFHGICWDNHREIFKVRSLPAATIQHAFLSAKTMISYRLPTIVFHLEALRQMPASSNFPSISQLSDDAVRLTHFLVTHPVWSLPMELPRSLDFATQLYDPRAEDEDKVREHLEHMYLVEGHYSWDRTCDYRSRVAKTLEFLLKRADAFLKPGARLPPFIVQLIQRALRLKTVIPVECQNEKFSKRFNELSRLYQDPSKIKKGTYTTYARDSLKEAIEKATFASFSTQWDTVPLLPTRLAEQPLVGGRLAEEAKELERGGFPSCFFVWLLNIFECHLGNVKRIVQCLCRAPHLAPKVHKKLQDIYRKTVEAERVVVTATRLSLLTPLQTIGLFNYGLLLATVLRSARLIDHLEDILRPSGLPPVERLSYQQVLITAPSAPMAVAAAPSETSADSPIAEAASPTNGAATAQE